MWIRNGRERAQRAWSHVTHRIVSAGSSLVSSLACQLCHWEWPLWPWMDYFISPCLSSFICEIPPTKAVQVAKCQSLKRRRSSQVSQSHSHWQEGVGFSKPTSASCWPVSMGSQARSGAGYPLHQLTPYCWAIQKALCISLVKNSKAKYPFSSWCPDGELQSPSWPGY